MALSLPSGITAGISVSGGAFARWFPMPRFLFPPAAGIDISDTSIKWIVLEKGSGGDVVRSFGKAELPEGIVTGGRIQDVGALADTLSGIRQHLGKIEAAHVSLPEEEGFVFSMRVPPFSSRQQILSMVEFELEGRVPVAPSAAVFDFDFIQRGAAGDEIGVVVFPREIAEQYAAAFEGTGIRLLSLELEARSIARAVSGASAGESTALLVDFGRMRSGITVLKRGVPIFTSTVMVGGQAIDRILAEKLSLSPADVAAYKNEEGLLPKDGDKSPALEAMSNTISSLAEEVARHHHYWDTRRNERGERATPVECVLVVGGNANIKGICDFLAARVQAEVVRPDVWQNVCSFDDYIPPIDRHLSLEYATAIGLALRGARI